jgi:signal transduction histidine kinase
MKRNLLEHMLTASRRMAETRTLTPLLNYVMDETIALVGAERGYIVLVEPDGSLDFRIKRRQDGQALAEANDEISKSVLNQVIGSGQPLILRDAMADPHFSGATSVAVLKLRSIMCVPLISHGDTIGAIYVENRSIQGRFNHDDLPPLTFFANQAAVAIENAALNDDLEARVATRTQELEQAMLQVETGWAEAVEANRLRTVWLNNVVHDLRAPLVIISGSLSMLRDGGIGHLNPQQLEWINKSLETVTHIERLTSDLFDLSQLEVGGLILQRETIALQDFLKNVYDVALGLPWPESVTLDLEVCDPIPDVLLDPLRIRQVLLNLLSNAHKFTVEGSVTLHARPLAEKGEVLLGVADTGEGVAANNLKQLFKRFQQLDDNPDRRRRGAGLGLAICRELVEMHGGRIWAESTPGVGSNFIFSLPVA